MLDAKIDKVGTRNCKVVIDAHTFSFELLIELQKL